MDADDPARQLFASMLGRCQVHGHSRLKVACVTFEMAELQQARYEALDPSGQGAEASTRCLVPMCWMWGRLAQTAMRVFQPELLLLLGDDIDLSPAEWADMVLGNASQMLCIPLLADARPDC